MSHVFMTCWPNYNWDLVSEMRGCVPPLFKLHLDRKGASSCSTSAFWNIVQALWLAAKRSCFWAEGEALRRGGPLGHLRTSLRVAGVKPPLQETCRQPSGKRLFELLRRWVLGSATPGLVSVLVVMFLLSCFFSDAVRENLEHAN